MNERIFNHIPLVRIEAAEEGHIRYSRYVRGRSQRIIESPEPLTKLEVEWFRTDPGDFLGEPRNAA